MPHLFVNVLNYYNYLIKSILILQISLHTNIDNIFSFICPRRYIPHNRLNIFEPINALTFKQPSLFVSIRKQ